MRSLRDRRFFAVLFGKLTSASEFGEVLAFPGLRPSSWFPPPCRARHPAVRQARPPGEGVLRRRHHQRGQAERRRRGHLRPVEDPRQDGHQREGLPRRRGRHRVQARGGGQKLTKTCSDGRLKKIQKNILRRSKKNIFPRFSLAPF